MKTTIYIILLVIFGGCSNNSKEEINNFLLGESFLMINEKQDTFQIELLDNCVKIYSWDHIVYQDLEINEDTDGIKFYFDGSNFRLKTWSDNEIIFSNNESELKLIRIEDNKISPDLVRGKWIEEKYSSFLLSSIPPPPCPNFENDTFLIPSIEFIDSTAIINDFCSQQKWIYNTNLKFGIIRFGEFCTSTNQWRITELTNDTMIVNMRYKENNKVKYKYNITYIKHDD